VIGAVKREPHNRGLFYWWYGYCSIADNKTVRMFYYVHRWKKLSSVWKRYLDTKPESVANVYGNEEKKEVNDFEP